MVYEIQNFTFINLTIPSTFVVYFPALSKISFPSFTHCTDGVGIPVGNMNVMMIQSKRIYPLSQALVSIHLLTFFQYIPLYIPLYYIWLKSILAGLELNLTADSAPTPFGCLD